MNSVGIDVSKGKSTVVALRPMGEVALPPTEYLHTEIELEKLAYTILALGEDTRVVMVKPELSLNVQVVITSLLPQHFTNMGFTYVF